MGGAGGGALDPDQVDALPSVKFCKSSKAPLRVRHMGPSQLRPRGCSLSGSPALTAPAYHRHVLPFIFWRVQVCRPRAAEKVPWTVV
jgi:hypothetical protein